MRSLKILAVSASFVALTACAGLSSFLSPAAQPLEQAAVGAAVFAAVSADKATTTVQAARAARINQIAKSILALDTGSSMALTDVEIIVNSKVAALNLPAADQLLAQLLTASLGEAIQAQLALTSKGAVSPQTQVAIASVMNWIITDTGG
jgi:hypothetical protein